MPAAQNRRMVSMAGSFPSIADAGTDNRDKSPVYGECSK